MVESTTALKVLVYSRKYVSSPGVRTQQEVWAYARFNGPEELAALQALPEFADATPVILQHLAEGRAEVQKAAEPIAAAEFSSLAVASLDPELITSLNLSAQLEAVTPKLLIQERKV